MSGRAISMKAKHPNPLFERWLMEWRDAATTEPKRHCFNIALKSLKKYPLPLANGRECLLLHGFGASLCAKLDAKLKTHKQSSSAENLPNLPSDDRDDSAKVPKKKAPQPKVSDIIPLDDDDDNENNANDRNKQKTVGNVNGARSKKQYEPAYRSGPYGILCGLYSLHSAGLSSKQEVIVKSQPFCDKSYTKSEPGSFYTAWSSMSTLITKHLVCKEGNPGKFKLSEEGRPLARKLYEDAVKDPENADYFSNIPIDIDAGDANHFDDLLTAPLLAKKRKIVAKDPLSSSPSTSSQTPIKMSSSTSVTSATEEETFFFTPGSFKILLLVDTAETSGSKPKRDAYDEIIQALNTLCVAYEVRHLKVGDYTWICRDTTTQRELILPYIVERKRMDDLGASIKDGRFHEQKFRLAQSGIPHRIYLVESYGNNQHCGMPLGNIYQAATNTMLQDGFRVRFTADIRRTVQYLQAMTKLLTRVYASKTLMSCKKEDLKQHADNGNDDDDLVGLMTFKEFNMGAAKNKALKVREMFVRQLLQLSGVSVERALAIVEKYPTPRALHSAYNACATQRAGELLLADIEYGALRKRIGAVIATTIHQLYTSKQY